MTDKPCEAIGDDLLMPGWGCCKCRVYNGIQRTECKICGHKRCDKPGRTFTCANCHRRMMINIKADHCALCKRPWSVAGEIIGLIVHPVRRDLNPLCRDCLNHIRDVSDSIERGEDAAPGIPHRGRGGGPSYEVAAGAGVMPTPPGIRRRGRRRLRSSGSPRRRNPRLDAGHRRHRGDHLLGHAPAEETGMSIKTFVMRADQSPMNPVRWQLTHACGHEQWVTAKRRPATGKLARCPACESGKAPTNPGFSAPLPKAPR